MKYMNHEWMIIDVPNSIIHSPVRQSESVMESIIDSVTE